MINTFIAKKGLKMKKFILTSISAIFLGLFCTMGAIASVNFDNSEFSVVSNETLAVDPGIPISQQKMVAQEIVETVVLSDSIAENIDSISAKKSNRNIALFSQVKGGGFSLAQGGRSVYL